MAFILVAMITGLVLAFVFRGLNASHFDQLVLNQQKEQVAANLAAYYAATGSWQGLHVGLQRQAGQDTPPGGSGNGKGFGEKNGTDVGGHIGAVEAGSWGIDGNNRIWTGGEKRYLFGVADATGKIVIPVGAYDTVGMQLRESDVQKGVSIEVDGERVGTLLMVSRLPQYNQAEQQYLQYSNRALGLGILGSVLIAGIVGVVISRSLTKPLQTLTAAVQNMEKGQIHQQVPVTSGDEIGRLAEAFNRMSDQLEKSNQQRRQMTADIAHDLRTPLTIISGYVEAMQDGILESTPERLALIYSEIERLQHMVQDLQVLSQADAGDLSLTMQPLRVNGLIQQSAVRFQQQANNQGVLLSVDTDANNCFIEGDEARLIQVLDNLLSNALRYTPEGGRIALACRKSDKGIDILVSDTGKGISPAELPLIFNRFHRGDRSRHTDGQESGLGLAIVKSLVEAHHGQVTVRSEAGKGTTFVITLPEWLETPKNL